MMVRSLSGGELDIQLGESSVSSILWFQLNGSEGSAMQVC